MQSHLLTQKAYLCPLASSLTKPICNLCSLASPLKKSVSKLYTHKCPNSCAIVKAVGSPLSSAIPQFLFMSHTVPISAKPKKINKRSKTFCIKFSNAKIKSKNGFKQILLNKDFLYHNI